MLNKIRKTVMRTYYVYVMASISKVIYIDVTNDLERRVSQHRSHETPDFQADTTLRGWFTTKDSAM
jgi:predicted GIY-YIG superfamily endonuclease